MGRVERRMYRIRQRRKRRLRWGIAGLLLAAAMLLIFRHGGARRLLTERLEQPSPTPVTSAFDQTVVTREVTLPEERWYAIQTGVFSTQEAAQEKAGAYTERGAPGVVVQDGAKWRVFIACYGSEADAAAVRTRLGESQRVETYLYSWVCPELRLRMTGMAGQLDVVEAGLTLLLQSAAQLRDAAMLLDAGQLTIADVQMQLDSLNGQLQLWSNTARERFGRSIPAVAQSLLALSEGWPKHHAVLTQAASSATTLSAELKGQGMRLFDDCIRLRNGIQSTQ